MLTRKLRDCGSKVALRSLLFVINPVCCLYFSLYCLFLAEEDIRRAEEAEERKRNRVIALKKDEDTELMRKVVKKHKKKVKKEKKKEKKRQKKIKELQEKAAADPDGDWKEQLKLLDVQVGVSYDFLYFERFMLFF